jgi:hypothetical protein
MINFLIVSADQHQVLYLVGLAKICFTVGPTKETVLEALCPA